MHRGATLGIVTALCALCNCTPRDASPAATFEPGTQTAGGFEALVEADAEPGYKKFQGIWLRRDDGERWVAAYRPLPWLMPFVGYRVQVTGQVYQPEGQAIMATHFRVETIQLADLKDEQADLTFVGPEQQFKGVFEDRVGAQGTKMEGVVYRVFTTADGWFLLANRPDGVVLGREVSIVARSVKISPYTAHIGGPRLFVLEIRPSTP